MDAFVQILMATLGSFGFNILFNIRGRRLLIATLGGTLSWIVYLALVPVVSSEYLRYFWSAAAVTAYGEVFARVCKTPTTTFLVPSVVPLIPGGSLYHTMHYAMEKQWDKFSSQGFKTLQLALALAVGIIAVTTAVRLAKAALRRIRKRKTLR